MSNVSRSETAEWWIANTNVGDVEDCVACGVIGDQCPVHHGIALGIEWVAGKLRALGEDSELLNYISNPTEESK